MAQKAILVTNANRDQLANRFNEDNSTGVPIAVGYYLVANFGDHFGYEMLSAAKFNAKYLIGEKLKNGFFEAVLRNPHGGA